MTRVFSSRLLVFLSQSRKFLAENFVEARRLTRYVEQFAEFLKMRGAVGGKA